MKHKKWTRVPGARRVGKVGAATALLSAGLALSLTQASAQDAPPAPTSTTKPAPVAQPPSAKKPTTTPQANKKSGPQAPALHVVPTRRPGRGVPGAPPITITPNGPPPGGPPGAFPAIPTAPPGAPGPDVSAAPSRRANSAPGATTLTFDFHGSDIGDVLKFYAKVANKTIIADPSLTGKVTIINPSPVTVDEAFMILQQVLLARNFTAIQKQGLISIVPFATGIKQGQLINPTTNPSGPTAVDPQDQVMTQVIPLENVEAQTLAQELQPLINVGASLVASSGTNSLVLTDASSNVQRFIALAQALDKASTNTELRTYPLRRADAGSISDIINNVYKQMSPRGRGQGGAQPGQPGFNPGMPPNMQQPGGSSSQPAVLAVPDTRTNSVLVVASPDNQQRIAEDIINRLDADDANTLNTQIRKINFANAVDVANLVNSVLNNNLGAQTSGGSGSTFQQRAFGGGGFFGGFFGGGGQSQSQQTVTSNDPLGKVLADPRTNTVVITASTDRMNKINGLIDSIDQDVPAESQTFVFQLKNAQAADIATALSTAFQTTQSGGGNTIFNFGGSSGGGNPSSQNRPTIQRRLGQNSGSGNGNNGRAIGRYAPPGPPPAPDGGDQGDGSGVAQDGGSAIPQGVQGVMTADGQFIPTVPVARPGANVDPQQSRQFGGRFGGGFGGFGGGQQNQNAPQYARGQNGNFVNLLQMLGQVYVTPSPNGDSVIVSTAPANYNAVKQIIDALDVVPRQVLIETIVAEVTLTKDQKLGTALQGLFANLAGKPNTGQGIINLGQSGTFNQGTTGLGIDPTATGAQFVINGANYTGLLQALQNDTNVKILAATDVFTSNNQVADTNSSEEVPYISGTTSTGLTTSVSSTIVFQQIGYELNVTPRITREGGVTMDVDTIATSLLGFQTLAGNQVPIVNQRETNTEATAEDGQTVVIGGLIQSTDSRTISKIPFLSDIPLVGQFFRSRERNQQRSELVIFLTPHVVNTSAEARDITKRMGANVSHQIPELGTQEPNLNFKPNGKSSGVLPTAPNTGGKKSDTPAGASQSHPGVPGLPQSP